MKMAREHLNSYSIEISLQNKFFNMYIVKEKATKRLLMQNFLPGLFKMTNFDRFHREAMGVRGLLSISRLLVYFFDERPPCAPFLLGRRSERLCRRLVKVIK